MVTVTGKFKAVGPSVGFVPDRNAPSAVPSTILVTAFTQFPGIAPHFVVPSGAAITVEYDTVRREIQLPVTRWLDRDLLAAYPDGSVTLGLVQSVGRQQATVFVHPTLPIVMTREDVSSAARDVLDRLLTDGDVIPVRITRGPNGNVKLRAHDINDDEPVLAAPELYPGQGPWLEEIAVSTVDEIRERYLEQKRAFDETNSAMAKLAEQFDTDIEQLREVLAGIGSHTGEIPVPSAEQSEKRKTADAISEMATAHITRVINNYKRENLQFLEANKAMSVTLTEMSDTIRSLRADLSTERQRAQELEKRLGSVRDGDAMSDRRHHFSTAEEWISEEIRRFWIDSYTPADRIAFPLDRQPWSVLPSFAETFAALTDDGMDKAIKMATHIITGRNAVEHITEDHPLREGDENSRPEVVREDGAASRRAYIESHTAQARRLHYWRLRDGSIQLSRVGLHDDFTP